MGYSGPISKNFPQAENYVKIMWKFYVKVLQMQSYHIKLFSWISFHLGVEQTSAWKRKEVYFLY